MHLIRQGSSSDTDGSTVWLPGDVLLLRGTGWTAWANRAGQRGLRAWRPLQTAGFTHVALVVSPTNIADAMPGSGVRIRSWHEAAGDYQLSACRLARHPELAGLATDPEPLLQRVQYYYAQRYWLSSLARRTARHGAGIVCSQFVALVLQDLGLRPLVRTAMRALPSDIDHGTRGRHGWHQLPLRASLPRTTRLSQRAPSGEPAAQVGAEPSDDVAERFSVALSGLVGCILDRSMAVTEAALRHNAEADRLMLAMAAAMGRAQQAGRADHAQALLRVMDRMLQHAGLDGPAATDVSGPALLAQWRLLYVDAVGRAPQVLADADALQRLAAHRKLLADAVAALTRLAAGRHGQVQSFKDAVERVFQLGAQGRAVGLDLVAQLQAWGGLLLQDAGWLETEDAHAIVARTGTYTALVQGTLVPLAPRLGHKAAQEALDQLHALAGLDEQRLRWVVEARPTLQVITDTLAGLLGGDATAAGVSGSAPARL